MASQIRFTRTLAVAISLAFSIPTVPSAQVCGDVNGSGLLNIADVTYLFAYLGGGGPPPVNFFDSEVDDFELITMRDLYTIHVRIYAGGPPPICGPANAAFPAPLDSAFILSYGANIPPNSTTATLALELTMPQQVAMFTLPLRIRVGDEIPQIDTLDFSALTPLAYPRYLVDSSEGTVAAAIFDIRGGASLDTGVVSLAELGLSFAPSPEPRLVTIEFVTLSPAQAPAPDSSFYPMLLLPATFPSFASVGIRPLLRRKCDSNGGNDLDQDCVENTLDNCPNTHNESQLDSDGDGFGDACDLCPTVATFCPGCCQLAGDANYDGSTNIADVTFLIARIFASGSAPPCHESANANGDSAVNISDVTYLIARIFAGGPEPACG